MEWLKDIERFLDEDVGRYKMHALPEAEARKLIAAVRFAEKALARHRPPIGTLGYEAWVIDMARLRSGDVEGE